jgi:hypothetical protein
MNILKFYNEKAAFFLNLINFLQTELIIRLKQAKKTDTIGENRQNIKKRTFDLYFKITINF